MKNIDKIQQMTVEDWFNQVEQDEHITASLCFMCVGCAECDESCAFGIAKWLEQERED